MASRVKRAAPSRTMDYERTKRLSNKAENILQNAAIDCACIGVTHHGAWIIRRAAVRLLEQLAKETAGEESLMLEAAAKRVAGEKI
jgi:hypothetical protein